MTEKKTTRRKTHTKPSPMDFGPLNMSATQVCDSTPGVEVTTESLGFWASHPSIEIPSHATEGSAGMDIRAHLPPNSIVKLYTRTNVEIWRSVKDHGVIFLEPGERALIPTGVYADIPDGYWVAIHPRSGTSWKEGLILTNGVGVVDSDYVDEIKVSLTNNSGVRVAIGNTDRIAQLVLRKVESFPIVALSSKPQPKTSRSGGFGSTGK